ncbi:alpha/beta fold hydrolase [Rhodococcus hoagii]|nr:alpha/beta fold hydrolase [Prescottella equi]
MTATEELTYESTSRFAQVRDDLKLHYHERESATAHDRAAARRRSRRVVVVQLRENIPVLAQQFHVIAVDQPGYGRSDKPTEHPQYFRHSASALKDLLDTIGITERVHLCWQFARRRCSGAVRAGLPRSRRPAGAHGPRWPERQPVRAGSHRGRPDLGKFAYQPTRRTSRRSCASCVRPELITDELIDERFAAASAPESLAAAKAMGRSFSSSEFELGMLWRDAYKLRQRVLLIWGREDRVNPIDGALVALKMIPRVQLHVFGGCGHWAQLEKFDEFNRLASDFLLDSDIARGSAREGGK